MWICPKCETYNRDGDNKCFICACEYKVYLYHQGMKQQEAAAAAKARAEEERRAATLAEAVEVAKEAERSLSSSSKPADTKPAAAADSKPSSPKPDPYTDDKDDFIRRLEADRSSHKYDKPKKSHGCLWAIIIYIILCLIPIIVSQVIGSSDESSSSSNKRKSALYSISMEYNPGQVIECQNDTYFL